MCGEPMKSEDDHKYDKWSVQSAVDALVRAKEIEQDPKMMELVLKEAKKKATAINSVADLRKKKAEVDEEALEKLKNS